MWHANIVQETSSLGEINSGAARYGPVKYVLGLYTRNARRKRMPVGLAYRTPPPSCGEPPHNTPQQK